MAVPANFSCPDRDNFKHCYQKVAAFVYRDENSVKTDLNILLDQLNSLDYSTSIVSEEDGNLLLSQLCHVVPLHQERLVVKFSQITFQWKRRQMLHLSDQCRHLVVDYFIRAIQRCQAWARPDILRTLACIFYEKCDKVSSFHEGLMGEQGILVQLINDDVTDSDTLAQAVQCLECITLKPSSSQYIGAEHIRTCFDVFLMLLHRVPTTKMDPLVLSKIVVNCLRGLQNVIQLSKTLPLPKLGVILAAVRAYMFHGLYSQPTVVPEALYPNPYLQSEGTSLGAMAQTVGPEDKGDNDAKPASQKKSKKKKTKKQSEKLTKQDQADTTSDSTEGQGHTEGTDAIVTTLTADARAMPIWARISSSESEWSDTEGGQGSRLRSTCTKVRQCALSCFYWIVKNIDKRQMFGYWSSFIPDYHSANLANTQTLFTIALKDPSPKCRMGALAALSVLIDGTKPLLTAAEDSDDTKTSTFTPFSVSLGCTIKELHRCLLLAMVSENSPITLTQLIKCFGTVIANVPYHRMRPGLLSRIVKQIRHFIYHRDPNVRVACLTCLGAMASIQPPLMEVCHIIQPTRPSMSTKPPGDGDASQLRPRYDSGSGTAIGPAPMLDSGTSGTLQDGGGSSEHSGATTPRKETSSSGSQTPVYSDLMLQAHAKEISWLVKLCMKNALPTISTETGGGGQPLPVRLESLQVLANLTKGYFPIIRNCVPFLEDLVHKCYRDPDVGVKLHTAKLLDEFTQVLLQDLEGSEDKPPSPDRLDRSKVYDFWMSLLTGPVPEILQNPSYGSVRASTCDCLANIGDDIFSSLPVDKRMMCITLTLGLVSDEDRLVRASAVRTLGVYMLYKTLREDVSFVVDVTVSIISGLQDKSVAVKVKAAWSLANLCDALAINRQEGNSQFVEEYSEVLLLNIITMATKACQDIDKVKANGVRSLGNILKYLSAKSIGKDSFANAIALGMKALVKCVGTGAMKVRWNACYAVGNMYKNSELPTGTCPWNESVINALCTAVRDCKNFKVRINAVIALTSPRLRPQYGDCQLYCLVLQRLIESFGTADNISDFIDFRYMNSLTDQISSCILHLLELMGPDDLAAFLPVLQCSGEVLATCLDKYYTSRLADSQIDVYLPKARENLQQLATANLDEEQTTCHGILSDLIQQLVPPKETFELPYLKTGFLQTYD